MHWNQLLEPARKAALQIEEALSHTTDISTLEELLQNFHSQLEEQRVQCLHAGEPALHAYKELEKKLITLRRRINIIRLSTTEEEYTKKREDSNFYDRNTEKLKKYIKISSHSIHSLDKQKSLLNKSRKKLEDGLLYLGVSDRLADQISNRYLTDYRIFKGLVAVFLLAFIYVFFIR
ncbi:hypothetical protein NEFER03_2066 [Nematocida sp. LUAm3]|nr:hypothetical protein NEFER03_2066 [Nematocida sp. LUAm3]KAI5176216.1 hypothetical protein NEFER02_2022 [Nematocida sp. LUAm2]KAI5179204.1 hypothetical protein NEFER01_2061 [Nematocida sp. LUAm1]